MRKISGILAFVLAATVLVGCSARHDDAWLLALRGREATVRPLRAVGSADGAFASSVPAALRGNIEVGEEADYLALDIGSETPIECALYHDEVEAASTLQTLAAQVFTELEDRHGVPIERAPAAIDAGVIGGSPFLRLSWNYRSAGEKGEVVGQLKQMIAIREGRSVYCVHHENGYAKTFELVFGELIANMRFASYDELRPYFTQIDVLSSGGERFGFSTVALTLDEDGEPRVVRYSTQIARNPAGSITAQDVTAVEHATVQGELRGQIFTDFRDGEISSSLVLEDLAGVGWQVRGQRRGENMRAIFEQPGLSSWLGETRLLGALVSVADDARRHAQSRVWVPEINAEASVERSYERVGPLRDSYWQVSALTGDLRSTLAVDATGLIHAVSATDGEREVLRERIFVEGALR